MLHSPYWNLPYGDPMLALWGIHKFVLFCLGIVVRIHTSTLLHEPSSSNVNHHKLKISADFWINLSILVRRAVCSPIIYVFSIYWSISDFRLWDHNMTAEEAYQYFVLRAQEIAISKSWTPVNWYVPYLCQCNKHF